jgi:hypothetical protein
MHLDGLDETFGELEITEMFAHRKIGLWTVRAYSKNANFESQHASLKEALERLVIKIVAGRATAGLA